MITRVCLSVGWFNLVGSFVRCVRCDFIKSAGPISMKFYIDVQRLRRISVLTFERSRSKVKVKRRTENLPIIIA